MIGDHKQLRPSVNVYELQTKYNFNISMFERLINNGFQQVMLLNQRRMRPEISNLTRNMYPELTDDAIVMKRPPIRGVKHTVFFMDHKFKEMTMKNSSSKVNHVEAELIVKFTEYLLKY